LEELRAHALHLVLHGRTRVEGAHDGAQPTRSADGGEARDARADDEHLRRRDLARGGHLTREEPAEQARRFDHRAVTGDVRHGAQRVHLLGAGDARHLVHGEGGDVPRRQLIEELAVLRRPEEADQRPSVLDEARLMLTIRERLRWIHLEHHVARGPRGPGVGQDLRPYLLVVGVGEGGELTGALLDDHLEALLRDQAGDGLGGARHPALTRAYFFDDGDFHGGPPPREDQAGGWSDPLGRGSSPAGLLRARAPPIAKCPSGSTPPTPTKRTSAAHFIQAAAEEPGNDPDHAWGATRLLGGGASQSAERATHTRSRPAALAR